MNLSPTTRRGNDVLVGIAEMAVLKDTEQVLVTHALGSCIGLTVYDPSTRVGGLLHYMLDRPRSGGGDSEKPAAMFATTGIPALFREAYRLGAKKEELIVCAAGAAEMFETGPALKIGTRNRMILRKLFWKNNVVLSAEDTGGSDARTLRLDLQTGEVTVHSRDRRTSLWKP